MKKKQWIIAYTWFNRPWHNSMRFKDGKLLFSLNDHEYGYGESRYSSFNLFMDIKFVEAWNQEDAINAFIEEWQKGLYQLISIAVREVKSLGEKANE